jgi:plastocyanin
MRRLFTGMMVVSALLALAAPALAGGWASVRLDDEPADVLVGKPWMFGFMVLQHDVSPNSDVTPVLRAQHQATGEAVTATSIQEGAVGHFVVEVTFPFAGNWKWSIQPEPFAETSFETLTVLDADGDEAGTAAAQLSAGTPIPAPELTDETTIEMLDSWAFQPSRLEVAPGTTVTWINTSTMVHSVTGDELTFDDSGLIEPGASFHLTFSEPGTYSYRCSPHPGMEGVVEVVG